MPLERERERERSAIAKPSNGKCSTRFFKTIYLMRERESMIHTNISTYTNTTSYIQTYKYIHAYKYIYTHKDPFTHTCIHNIHTPIHTYIHKHILYTYTIIYMHGYICTYMIKIKNHT